jgi:hypothetical protein
MGFRARKSFQIAKGVRLNVSKSGVGMSVGGRGLRYSAHSSGRRTTTAGIPGKGVAWQSTHGGSAGARPRGSAATATAPAMRPEKQSVNFAVSP